MRIEPLETGALASARAPTPNEATSPAADSSGAPSFDAILGRALGEANALNATASQKVAALASGAVDDLHGTMISTKEADIAIKLVGTVRNKLIDAFNELWRTSV